MAVLPHVLCSPYSDTWKQSLCDAHSPDEETEAQRGKPPPEVTLGISCRARIRSQVCHHNSQHVEPFLCVTPPLPPPPPPPVFGCSCQPCEVDFTIIRPISQMGMLRHRETENFPRTPHDEQMVEMGFEPHPWGCAVWSQSLRLSSRASLRHQAALFSLLLGAICHVFILALNCSFWGQDPWMHKQGTTMHLL